MIKNQIIKGSPKSRSSLLPYFYCPRAYEYIQNIFSLPHTNSLTESPSSINCELGFFMDVFRSLKGQIDENPTHIKGALLFDAKSIKSSAYIIQLVIMIVMLIMVKVLLCFTKMLLLKKH